MVLAKTDDMKNTAERAYSYGGRHDSIRSARVLTPRETEQGKKKTENCLPSRKKTQRFEFIAHDLEGGSKQTSRNAFVFIYI